MNKNANMNKAKSAKNDEFYTNLDDVSIEVIKYKEQFKGKKVLCNCNDGPESSFFRYFTALFFVLGLKKLTCISYMKDGHGIKYEWLDSMKMDFEKSAAPGLDEYITTELQGDGSFDSDEAVRALDEADVVVTNPPFSRFRDFIDLLVAHGKKFLVIGNKNAYKYKGVFPLFMQNRLWVGYNSPKEFRQPDGNEPKQMNGLTRWFTNLNVKKFGNIGWFTNLNVKKHHEEQILFRKYTPEKYPKYDNYDAINVNEVCEIPEDYHGVMGVPITFLDHYNPDQFEVVGLANHGTDSEYDLVKPMVDGKYVYTRVLIRARNMEAGQ